jgi:hypothetical protein
MSTRPPQNIKEALLLNLHGDAVAKRVIKSYTKNVKHGKRRTYEPHYQLIVLMVAIYMCDNTMYTRNAEIDAKLTCLTCLEDNQTVADCERQDWRATSMFKPNKY